MSDPTSASNLPSALPPPPPPAPEPAIPVLDSDRALGALANPTRLSMLLMLREGHAVHATQFAKTLGGNFDTISKHLRILRDAHLIRATPHPDDTRYLTYTIPPACLATPGIIDYGILSLRTEELRARRKTSVG